MIKFIILSIILLALNSCAVFHAGNVKETRLSEIKSQMKKPSLSYIVQVNKDDRGISKVNKTVQSIIEGEFIEVLKNSNFFSRISINDETADLKININVKNDGNPAAMIPAVITGLTLYVIPSWVTEHFEVEAKVYSKGNLTKYSVNDKVTLVQWLPMIFFMPTHPLSRIPKVRMNMYRAILAKIQDDGLIPR